MSDTDLSLDVLVGQVGRACETLNAAAEPKPHLLRHAYVVFGSAVLWLHDVRDEVGDIDAFVHPHVWNELHDWNGWNLVDPRPGEDPPFLELDLTPAPSLHVFYGWTSRDAWMNVSRCYSLSETVRGVRCIPISEVARHKRQAYRDNPGSPEHEKHLADLRLLEERGLA